MMLQDLTLLTLVLEFLPPLFVSFVYLLFFKKRKSKLIEVFIMVMYLKTILWFLLEIVLDQVTPLANPGVNTTELGWALLTDLIFQFAVSLQEFLTWITIAFYAVLMGMGVLAVKLLLQDPMKVRFRNIIRRITNREPETDGFTSFNERVKNIRFEGVEPQPLDPEVQERAWSSAWRDYVIIGFATLIPSISAYVGNLPQFIRYYQNPFLPQPSSYYLGVLVLFTWIYRFGYPASNRIAKGAGLHLGNRDIGSEMMHGVLGWFFRLNILWTLYTLVTQAITFLTSSIADIGTIMIQYYKIGLILAAPPIIFAVVILPLVEDFAVVFYKKLFEAITQARPKIKSLNLRQSIVNCFSGVGTGLVVSLAFIGAVIAATLNYTDGMFLFPRQLGDTVKIAIESASDFSSMLPSVIWTLMMLGIPFAFMLLIGIFGYFVRKRLGGGAETFAFFSGFTITMVTYYFVNGMDYFLGVFPSNIMYAGQTFNRLIPFPEPPQDVEFIWRLVSQFVINLPMFIFTALFILYFFDFRTKWKEIIGDREGPLLNIRKRDAIDASLMFFGGLLVSLIGVLILTMVVLNPVWVRDTLQFLFAKIGNPDGLEAILIPRYPNGTVVPPLDRITPGGWFLVFAEHNIVRTFLMVIIGPVFWSAVLWFGKAKKNESEKRIGTWSVVVLILCGAISVIWTQLDAMMHVFNPADPLFGFTAQLGYRSVIVFGLPVLLISFYIIARYLRGDGIGAWWFPIFIMLFAIEYFIYDDQFTLLAIIVLPLFVAGGYRLLSKPHIDANTGEKEGFLFTYIKFSLMSLAIAEVLSTALILGGISIIHIFWGGNILQYLSTILPHAVVEIPVFLIAAAAAIRVSKDLWPTIDAKNWDLFPAQTRKLLSDERTWRTLALIAFLLMIAALIEAYVTPLVAMLF